MTAAVMIGIAGFLQTGTGFLMVLSGSLCLSSGPLPASTCPGQSLVGTLFLVTGAIAMGTSVALYQRPDLHTALGGLNLLSGALALAVWIGAALNPQLDYSLVFPPFPAVMLVAGGILALGWKAEPTRWGVIYPSNPPPAASSPSPATPRHQ